MSDTKFTPAPWEYRDVSGAGNQIYGVVPFKADCVEFTLKADAQPLYTMLVYETWIQFEPKEWSDMQAANAHLIAAAPDMYKRLEACTELLAVIVNHADLHNWDAFSTKEINDSRKVLAKARGEDQ